MLSIVAAIINLIAQPAWLGSTAAPLRMLTVIALDVIVIFALTAKWGGYPEAVGRELGIEMGGATTFLRPSGG